MTTPLTPVPPPRTTERLLESLGADPEFRDALLGDLAEEHALRVGWDGGRAADRWYRREALRVAPHLLRDGVRRLGWHGVRRVAGAVMTAYIGAYLAHILAGWILMRTVELLCGAASGGTHPLTLPLTHPIRGPLALALLLVATASPPVVSGFVAASVEDEAPVFPVLAVGAAQLGTLFVQLAIGFPGPTGPAWLPGPTVPTWVMACQCLLVAVGPVAGGVLRVRDRARERPPLPLQSPS